MASYSDNFNRANGEIGGNWIEDAGDIDIVANAAVPQVADSYNRARYSSALASANHRVVATLGRMNGVSARQAGSAFTCYSAEVIAYDNASGYKLRKYVNGALTELDSAMNYVANGTIRITLEVDGASQVMKGRTYSGGWIEDAEVASAADAAITEGAYAGIVCYHTLTSVDDWSAEDLAGGGSYTLDVAGATAIAGTLSRRTSWTRAGAAVGTGGVLKAVGRALVGTTTPAAALTRQPGKAVAGTSAAAGSLARRTGRSLAGTAVAAGALATVRVALLALVGTVVAAGTVTKRAGKGLAGAGTLAGSLVKAVGRAWAGEASAAGAVATLKTKLLALAGTVLAAGTLTRRTGRTLDGGAAPTGAIIKRVGRSFAGSATLAGTLVAVRAVLLALAGTLTAAGTLTKVVSKGLTGTVATAGALTKRVARTIAGVVSASAGLVTHWVPFGQTPWVSATLSRVWARSHIGGRVQAPAPGRSRIVAPTHNGSIRRIE